MPEVKRDVLRVLRDQDHFPTERVGDPDFVKDVCVSACAVAHDNTGSIDQRYDVLNNRSLFPDIISAPTPKPDLIGSFPNGLIYWVEACIERHHRRREVRIDILVLRNLEDCWSLAWTADVSEQEPIDVYVF